jgi:hypothetical protein
LQEAVEVFLEAVQKRPHYYAAQVTLWFSVFSIDGLQFCCSVSACIMMDCQLIRQLRRRTNKIVSEQSAVWCHLQFCTFLSLLIITFFFQVLTRSQSLKSSIVEEKSLLLYQFTRRAIKPTILIIVGYHCYQLHTEFYPILVSFCEG